MKKNSNTFWNWLFKPCCIQLPTSGQRKPWVWSASPFVIFIFVLLFGIFLMLANWQYQKGKRLEQHTQSNIQLRDQSFHSLREVREAVQSHGAAMNRAKVSFTASILGEPIVLHDNRVRDQGIGLDVLLWLQTDRKEDRHNVLLNLGWMPWPDRSQFPLSKKIRHCFKQLNNTQNISVVAEVIVPPSGLFHLNKKYLLQRVGKSPETFLIQSLEQSVISQTLPTNSNKSNSIEPYILWLKNSPEVLGNTCPLQQNWPDPNSIGMSAEKHQSYALQWLSFAVILLGLFVGLNMRRSVPPAH